MYLDIKKLIFHKSNLNYFLCVAILILSDNVYN